jgi:DNA mismatch endonuclease (patch repair protein)
MADSLMKGERSERMSRVRGRDTVPEMSVRRLVHGMGYRYRLHRRNLPGKPDLVFPSRRKIIFVHGCFWYRHPDPACKLARLPKSKLDFWLPKLERNRERDLKVQKQLVELGWEYFIIWECEVSETVLLMDKVKFFLDGDSNENS